MAPVADDTAPPTLEGPWTLDERVQIRPERFGGLLYHFGTRQLSFVKAPDLLAVVRLLVECPTVDDALDKAEIPAERRPAIVGALVALAASGMIQPRIPAGKPS